MAGTGVSISSAQSGDTVNVTLTNTGDVATAALTKTDDTNVTLTLGGSPSTALVNAASLTLGWTGVLSLARGGTAVANSTAASGTFLRGDGTGFATSTLILPNALTVNRVLYGTSTDTVGSSANLAFSGTVLTVTGSGTGNVLIGEYGGSNAYGAISLMNSLATTGYNFASSAGDTHLYINRPTGKSIFFRENNGFAVGTGLVTFGPSGAVTTEGVLTCGAITSAGIAAAGQVVTRAATIPSFAGNGSIIAGGSDTGATKGPLVGVNIPYVTNAFGGHVLGYNNSVNPKWLIGLSRGSVDENALVYFEDSLAASARLILKPGGYVGIRVTDPTASLHLPAGSATASTAPLKFTSGTLLTTAEVGVVEFLTDKFYATITTGAARKEFTLNDAALTSGRIPTATTNGRLTDGPVPVADATYNVDGAAAGTVSSFTTVKGIITAITTR